MSYNRIFLLLCFIIPVSLFAQRIDEHKTKIEEINVYDAVSTFDKRLKTEYKQFFFSDDWLQGRFLFEEEETSKELYLLKYDILNQELNISVDSAAYLVPSKLIRGFILDDYRSGQLVFRKFKFFEQYDKAKQFFEDHRMDFKSVEHMRALVNFMNK